MKAIKYLFISSIFMFFMTFSVNAEIIGVRRIGESKEFNVLIRDVNNVDTINVVEGTLSFDKTYIENIEIISNGNWKYKTLVEDNKIKFVSYIIGDFAKNEDSLFKVLISFYEDVDLKKEQILITDMVTNNGRQLFEFEDIKFKLIDDVENNEIFTQSNPIVIGKDEIKVELPSEELLKEEAIEIVVPENDIVNEIKESNEKQDSNGLLAIVICITCLIISIIVNSIIHFKTSQLVICNNQREVKLSRIEPMITKQKRRGRKHSSTTKGDE